MGECHRLQRAVWAGRDSEALGRRDEGAPLAPPGEWESERHHAPVLRMHPRCVELHATPEDDRTGDEVSDRPGSGRRVIPRVDATGTLVDRRLISKVTVAEAVGDDLWAVPGVVGEERAETPPPPAATDESR